MEKYKWLSAQPSLMKSLAIKWQHSNCSRWHDIGDWISGLLPFLGFS